MGHPNEYPAFRFPFTRMEYETDLMFQKEFEKSYDIICVKGFSPQA